MDDISFAGLVLCEVYLLGITNNTNKYENLSAKKWVRKFWVVSQSVHIFN